MKRVFNLQRDPDSGELFAIGKSALPYAFDEIRAFEAERSRSGFDYRGEGVERMSATDRARWEADFNRNYLAAHSEALAAEYAAIVTEALASAPVTELLHKMGLVPRGGTPEQFMKKLQANRDRWGPVIRETGMKMDG